MIRRHLDAILSDPRVKKANQTIIRKIKGISILIALLGWLGIGMFVMMMKTEDSNKRLVLEFIIGVIPAIHALLVIFFYTLIKSINFKKHLNKASDKTKNNSSGIKAPFKIKQSVRVSGTKDSVPSNINSSEFSEKNSNPTVPTETKTNLTDPSEMSEQGEKTELVTRKL